MALIKKFDHVSIAVKDMDKALDYYINVLGGEIKTPKFLDSEMGFKFYWCDFMLGGVKIELVQPLDENDPIARYMKKHGEGLHHISLQVEDIKEALRKLEEDGSELLDKNVEGDGWKWAYISPKDSFGALIQLWEKND